MKKSLMYFLIFTLALILGSSVAFAGKGNNGLYGQHWQFNIIGHPKNVDVLKNDNSNGRAIMVPLKTSRGPSELFCEGDQEYLVENDTKPSYQDVEPLGAKIHFVAGDDFEIIDRDATDKDGAKIMVPATNVDGEDVISVDVWVRALGKPNMCMDIEGYAYDDDQDLNPGDGQPSTGLWFWSGTVHLKRKHGQASWVKVNELFEVWFCQVDPVTDLCIAGTIEELSVFSDVFEDYFWNILNDGTRIVQVRLYPN